MPCYIFFKKLSSNWDLNLVAVTVDHQLRKEESAEDCHFVKEICRDWEIPCVTRAVDVRQYQKEKKALVKRLLHAN